MTDGRDMDPGERDPVDDEFEKIMAGLDFSSGGAEENLSEDDFPPLEQVVEKPQVTWNALILSPVDAPRALRAALDLVGSPEPVVQLGSITAVYLDEKSDPGAEETGEDADLLALLGDERPIPEPVDKMAKLVSKLAKPGSVALVAFTAEDTTVEVGEGVTPPLSGTILGRRYVGGKSEDKVSAGLVLAGLPLAAEELLLGRLAPSDVPDVPRGPWTGWLKGRGRHF